jgi:hypothetical protein
VPDKLDPLIRDLVEWVAKEPRPYTEVLEAWRTSCPRLTVWEDACDRGYVERRSVDGKGVLVIATEAGRALLRAGSEAPKLATDVPRCSPEPLSDGPEN